MHFLVEKKYLFSCALECTFTFQCSFLWRKYTQEISPNDRFYQCNFDCNIIYLHTWYKFIDDHLSSMLPSSAISYLIPKWGHYVFRCWQQLHEDIIIIIIIADIADIFVKTAGNGFTSMRPCIRREAWDPDVNNNTCMKAVFKPALARTLPLTLPTHLWRTPTLLRCDWRILLDKCHKESLKGSCAT